MTPAQTRDAIVAEMREYADTSDGCQYGTISTRLLRDFADRLAALPVGDGEPWAGHHFAEQPGGIWRCVDKGCGFTIHTAPPPAAFIVDPQAGTVTPAPAAPCPYVRSGDEGTHYCTLSGPPAVPAGFVLVPVEPTQSMLDANGDCPGYPEGKAWLERDARETWKAMLAARPDAPAGEKGT